jgi:hypothetical protein
MQSDIERVMREVEERRGLGEEVEKMMIFN